MGRGMLWGVILAGGDGQRMRTFVQSVLGADRPKQFCAFIGTRSMLRHTVDRASWLIPPERTLTVVTAGHGPFVADDLVATPPRMLLEQPCNRDTAPGILLPLAVILRDDPDARVALFPSDHFILEEGRFITHVAQTAAAIGRAPDRTVLLGIAPDRATPGYGWIDAGASLEASPFHAVRRFWEKPEPTLTRRLFAAGYLLNTFVLVAFARTLWDLTRRCQPELVARFDRIGEAWGAPQQDAVLQAEYADMPPTNFSREVLERLPGRLAVLPVRGVQWCDWGEPARIADTVRRIGIIPEWMTRMEWAAGPKDPGPGRAPSVATQGGLRSVA